MQPDAKSRVDESVPQPDAAKQLSEEQKRALEQQDEAEHAQGEQKEQLVREAKKAE